MASNREDSFFRWFRVLPLSLVAMCALLAALLSMAPSFLMRSFFVPVKHEQAILDSSARHNVDPLLACSIISCESGWREDAESGVGAQGLMQMMDQTADMLVAFNYVDGSSYSPQNLMDPETNIEFGCAFLQYLQDNLENRDEIIAAYNAGLGAVQDWSEGSVSSLSDAITYPETRMYLIRVNETYDAYQSFYDSDLQPK